MTFHKNHNCAYYSALHMKIPEKLSLLVDKMKNLKLDIMEYYCFNKHLLGQQLQDLKTIFL